MTRTKSTFFQYERRRRQRQIFPIAIFIILVTVGIYKLVKSKATKDNVMLRDKKTSSSNQRNFLNKAKRVLLSIDHKRVRRLIEISTMQPKTLFKCQTQKGSTANETPEIDLFTLEQRKKGAIILHFCGLIYIFIALSIVCDEFFVPSLNVIAEKLEISDDVAGATFMAAGGSAPEFFASFFGVFVTQNNVGIGTIVGSATFNILCVLSFCALFSREVLHLTWWPLFRDMFFYIIALLFLVIFFIDETIEWHEAFALFFIYIIYGLAMKYNKQIEMKVKTNLLNHGVVSNSTDEKIVQPVMYKMNAERRKSIPVFHSGALFRGSISTLAKQSKDNENSLASVANSRAESRSPNKNLYYSNEKFLTEIDIPGSVKDVESHYINTDFKKVEGSVGSRSTQTTNAKFVEEDNNSEKPIDMRWPATAKARLLYVSVAPIMFPLYITLADVKKPSSKKYFIWTFIGSILWIAFFSYLMIWWASVIGETLEINNEIMGLTILAAGTSIPDLITSVIVARKGLGDMAVSSSIGSNLFDVCVGLPIPWLLYFITNWIIKAFHTVDAISVSSKGLICSVGMLFLMLILLVMAITVCKWRMNKLFGFIMIIAYITFCILSILLETGHIDCPLKVADAC